MRFNIICEKTASTYNSLEHIYQGVLAVWTDGSQSMVAQISSYSTKIKFLTLQHKTMLSIVFYYVDTQ